MVTSAVRSYVGRALETTGYEDLHALLKDFSDEMRLGHAAYVGCSLARPNDDPVNLSTYPREFTELYHTRNLAEIDPVHQDTKDLLLPYVWNDRQDFDPCASEFFRLASDFDARSQGVAVPVRGPRGDKGLISIVARADDSGWETRREELLSELVFFSQSFHAAIVQTARSISTPEVRLAPRERDVLTWAGRGKTAWETACILGLAETTVISYIRQACRKLDVASKYEAVAVCTAMNLIRI